MIDPKKHKNNPAIILFFCLAFISACKGTHSYDLTFHKQSVGAPVDGLIINPFASTQIPSGQSGIWVDNNGIPVLQGADNTQWRAGEASSVKLATCARLSGSFGKLCADQTLGEYYIYINGWKKLPQEDILLLHKAGAETITGRKTFPGGLSAPIIPSIVSGAGVQVTGHVVPNIADDTFALLLASQELRNKTINATYNTITGIPLATRNLIAGAGLTGGGDLSADRTFNVVANGDGSIVVNANDIQVGVITNTQHGTRAGGTLHADATTSVAGFMSAADKTKLDAMASVAILGAGATTAIAGGQTNYFTSAGISGNTMDAVIPQGNITRSGTLQKLKCNADSAPGSGQTETITIRKYASGSWASTTITCQLSGSSAPAECEDIIHTNSVVAGNKIGIEATQSAASTAANVTCSIELAF